MAEDKDQFVIADEEVKPIREEQIISDEDLVFVPAEPGEEAPEGVYVPRLNREQRRWLERAKNRRKLAKAQEKSPKFVMPAAKEVLKDEGFSNDLYRGLLENLQKKIEESKEEEDGTATEEK